MTYSSSRVNGLPCVFLFACLLMPCVHSWTCSRSNWWGGFDREGQVKCDQGDIFVRGFFRNDNGGDDDHLYLLEEAECCTRPSPWTYKWETLVEYANWWGTLDHNNVWATCAPGFFLHGFYRSGSSAGWLYHLEEGRCAKPAEHPSYWGHCYNHNIWGCFDNKGLCQCNENYFVTGIYRGNCDKLYCLEELKCCKMAASAEPVDEVYKVKNRIMSITLSRMALLAHYLGYGWCAGCRSLYVGEDFRKSGDNWLADKSGRCSGYKNDHRLGLAFGHWGFEIKSITYGNAVLTDLTPETIDSGTIYNYDSTQATQTIERSETSVRSVTHTTTSSWTKSHELGIEISYTPGPTGGVGGSISYKFGYETSSTTTDETSKEQSRTFSVSSSKTLEPQTAVKWSLILAKTRRTLAYTAVVKTKFSTEFQGFLRWGGGYHGGSTNYHYQHRGSGDRPTFNYRFGSSSVPFYDALKRESDTNSHPWQWNELKSKHSYVSSLISQLSDDGLYTFTLTGKIEDVLGKDVQLKWESVSNIGKRDGDQSGSGSTNDNSNNDSTKPKHLKNVAKAGPKDPPAPDVEPPKVDLKTGTDNPPVPPTSMLGD